MQAKSKTDVVFVKGLHRSGTTVAHFLLGAHPKCVALGETHGLISSPEEIARASEIPCSCGEFADRCAFWGPALPKLKGDFNYQPILDRVRDHYGERIIVDSSKAMPPIMPERHFNALLIRDVRAWLRSTGRAPLRGMHSWYKSNKKFLAEKPDVVISFDDLIIHPHSWLEKICTHLGLEPRVEEMLHFGEAEHHAIKGNRMIHEPEKMSQLAYDNRWAAESNWLLPAILMPHVTRFNREQVYGNGTDFFRDEKR